MPAVRQDGKVVRFFQGGQVRSACATSASDGANLDEGDVVTSFALRDTAAAEEDDRGARQEGGELKDRSTAPCTMP